MCTVTIVPKADVPASFRMACSRDEQRGRAEAKPPKELVADGVRVLHPVDPVSGGTWVGVNEFGLALTVLNYNLPSPPKKRDLSRGDVIPQLLHAESVDQVASEIAKVQALRMMPFRLVACDGKAVLMWRSTEPATEVQVCPWQSVAMMWTSSGLGDHLVEEPRRRLFESCLDGRSATYLEQQEAFHRHSWPGQEHLSVCMSREDARTVSYTVVDVDHWAVAMRYHPDRPDRPASQWSLTLQRRQELT